MSLLKCLAHLTVFGCEMRMHMHCFHFIVARKCLQGLPTQTPATAAVNPVL